MAVRDTVARTARRLGLAPAVRGARRAKGAAARFGARCRVLLSQFRWKTVVLADVALGVRLRMAAGRLEDGAVPVIVCLWNRPDRLPAIIAQLSRQRGCPPIRLILWNNNRAHDAVYRAHLGAVDDLGSVASIEYHRSRVNIGGVARFVVARQISRKWTTSPFLMLDDDQNVSPAFVSDLLAAAAPRTYAGCWAFVLSGDYWAREAAEIGEAASYVGTGGSVCDSALVHERGFFRRLPGRYGFIEDLWASVFASSRGWLLKKVDTPVEFTMEEHNQYNDMIWLKGEFYRRLLDLTEGDRPL